MKKIMMIAMTLLTTLTTSAKDLELKDIATNAFYGETMGGVHALPDG